MGVSIIGSALLCSTVSPTQAHASEGVSNLQVEIDGEWRGVCCDGDTPVASDEDCWWTEDDRTLVDESADLELDCPEGDPTACECNESGERLHGTDGSHVDNSLSLPEGGPIFPNHGEETCVTVESDGALRSEWTDSSCPHFRLR